MLPKDMRLYHFAQAFPSAGRRVLANHVARVQSLASSFLRGTLGCLLSAPGSPGRPCLNVCATRLVPSTSTIGPSECSVESSSSFIIIIDHSLGLLCSRSPFFTKPERGMAPMGASKKALGVPGNHSALVTGPVPSRGDKKGHQPAVPENVTQERQERKQPPSPPPPKNVKVSTQNISIRREKGGPVGVEMFNGSLHRIRNPPTRSNSSSSGSAAVLDSAEWIRGARKKSQDSSAMHASSSWPGTPAGIRRRRTRGANGTPPETYGRAF
ncbi:hypothetical protein CMUS01_04973 [Colletotrichum musicola]|uniref:Uncharacterized protein n=1 Tax=Colletotrichum musicola TaxID=2175873 RepID=A0A8H6KUT7_9PEZI|nr:hypothetical protein CMUS01_04973 [Colletotrichum musicola]